MNAEQTSLQRCGAVAWMVRPLYLVVEIVVAALATTYSFARATVSDLGALDCTSDLCSPAHDVMNGAFIVFGALMALGAVLLFGSFGRGPMAVAASALLVVSGLSSIAVGLTPVDRFSDAHVLAAAPLFIAQPIALVLLGLLVRDHRPATGRWVIVTGVVCAIAATLFIVVDGAPGVTERIALWPVFVALAVVALPQRTSR